MLYLYRDENLAKIDKRILDYKVEIRNPPRAGKKLLVLDVDYTIFGVYISFNFFISLNKSYTFHQWKLSSVMIQLNNQLADFKNDTYCISQLVHALWKSLVNQNFV